jgi:SAM-dependent methyltransferase
MTSVALYDAAYFDRMRSGSKLYEQFLSLVTIADYRQKCILDVGCGRGDLLKHLIDCGCQEVAGVDFSHDALEKACSTIGTPPPGVQVALKEGSVTQRDLYAEGSFYLAYMTDIVEHLPPTALHAGLQNVRYWLKPSGRLVVHTFPTLGPHRLYRSILKLQGKTEELARLDAIHCNVQTRSSLRGSLQSAGFEIERLWVTNDFTLTSSAYQALRPGRFKAVLGKVLDNVVGGHAMRGVFGEYAAPSIYAVSRRAEP